MSRPENAAQQWISHRIIGEGTATHVAEVGSDEKPAIVFLHGWPQSWAAFAKVMISLRMEAHVVALDLPGIGGSTTPPSRNDKRALAEHVRTVIGSLGLTKVTLVGHDIGGMIVYAYLHAYPGELERAAILNAVIPGVAPWDRVVRNPHFWLFAFHAVPDLPEELVSGRQLEYFRYFYKTIAASPDGVRLQDRPTYADAYSLPEALHTGFEWYRAFPQDEKDNAAVKGDAVLTPVLYVRGDHDAGTMGPYLQGLRENGLENVVGRVIPNCGHFSLDEQPELVAAALREFMKASPSSG
ncbi:MAG: alpha/beta hydrolase [Thaumarchaeota archaeon]|nr:alpha/beta hydrolase [Nitrososphaerota archaeon]